MNWYEGALDKTHMWWRTWSMFYHAALERVRGAVHGPDSDVAPAEQPETETRPII